ncbi:MAG: SDR family NAD(P)-dependent oxidoreductase, partial [Acidimicrobiaceae bacterium]|nr:SDR family NAD(P)-dependent oxidoreductase [Acidimicrobiaceae bacterium]
DLDASVVACARNEAQLAALAGTSERISPVAADLTTEAGRRALLDAAGPLDGLVNDAGVGWVGLAADMPPAEIERIVALNVLAVLHLTVASLGQLVPGGLIVNIGSVMGYVASPPLTVYAASKFAVHGFSEGLRREVGRRDIRVALVTPGPVRSAFFPRAVHRPGAATVPEFPMYAPQKVAAAVARAFQRPGWPGYRRIAVPRVAGLTRLGSIPGFDLVPDVVARVTRSGRLLRPDGPS